MMPNTSQTTPSQLFRSYSRLDLHALILLPCGFHSDQHHWTGACALNRADPEPPSGFLWVDTQRKPLLPAAKSVF
jgi:hypothetical protein